ncbi:SAF domain-containing protein [Bacillus thuringiensis]|uniref:SAF domain-containing protein n=8 Tax=Bacillus cereus group TaxID=86661 RepID=A0A9Q1ZSL3_BACTU|nr:MULTISPECIES: SAF domain-containing protein [Bacillus]EEM40877.1 Spore coat polysaccharide biosynthesis protein spsF [Bacillus thuringiensis serovar sotto str. T04001]MED1157690.1 SAF domain-containing protein [Bacillus paranthracis]AFQ27150.1 spore coat polysaccharide biosynthesis protein SpsF [Bacillus thuringiensis HD-789]AJH03945.1 cytidylyltransferase family protein [Bacillus thuringiensis HD1002]AJQ60112.1 spore coat protein [Bacillus thuringiensis serovar morrisoni]
MKGVLLKLQNQKLLRAVTKGDIKKGEIITANKVTMELNVVENALTELEAEELLPQVAVYNLSAGTPITKEVIEPPKVVIIVLCRLKSTRLPLKAILPIHGVPSIERCLINTLAIPGKHQVILATSDIAQDDPLEKFNLDGKVKIFRGDPENTADRMFQAAKQENANIVIRITGDCPAVSPEINTFLLDEHLKSGADYTQAELSTLPVGTAGDIFTLEAIERLLQTPKPLTYAEYLPFYFINNPHLFRINVVKLPPAVCYPTWRLTLDEQPDLDMFNELYRGLNVKSKPLFFHQIKDYILRNPELIEINSHVKLKWANQQSLVDELNRETIL